jgi:hypothetical protein
MNIFGFFGGIGALTQDLHLEPFCQSSFVKGVFEIVSHEPFAWDGFEP